MYNNKKFVLNLILLGIKMKEKKYKIKKLLPPPIINKQIYKNYERKINKNTLLSKISEKDKEIKHFLLHNELNYQNLYISFEDILEKEGKEKFGFNFNVLFQESNNIEIFIEKEIIYITDAFHTAISLLLNSYFLYKIDEINLSKAYFSLLFQNITKKLQLKDLTLKKYSYFVNETYDEKFLDEFNLYKFEKVSVSLYFFMLHEIMHFLYPKIKDEVKIDNLAIEKFLQKFPKDELIYPYLFFKFIAIKFPNFKQREKNLKQFINTNDLEKFWENII